MKSLTAVCQTGASATMPAINASGRITRHQQQRGDGENAEMKMYLSKLKDLVPFMPKNRKLSKLEIIQHVIDYICDLQTELETHPDVNNFDAANALNNYAAAAAVVAEAQHDNEQNSSPLNAILSQRLMVDQQQQQHHQEQQQILQHNSSPAAPVRQPLVDRQTPNTILPNPTAALTTTITTTATAITQLSTYTNDAASLAAAATTLTPTVTSSTQQQQQQTATSALSSSTSSVIINL